MYNKIVKEQIGSIVLLISVNRNLPEIMTLWFTDSSKRSTNIKAHTMGVSNLKSPQAVEEML